MVDEFIRGGWKQSGRSTAPVVTVDYPIYNWSDVTQPPVNPPDQVVIAASEVPDSVAALIAVDENYTVLAEYP